MFKFLLALALVSYVYAGFGMPHPPWMGGGMGGGMGGFGNHLHPPPPPPPAPAANVRPNNVIMSPAEKCFRYRRCQMPTTDSWFTVGDRCYYVVKDAASSVAAEAKCENLVLNGKLATVNAVQNWAVASALAAFGIDSAIIGYIYGETNSIYAYNKNDFQAFSGQATATDKGCVKIKANGEWWTATCDTDTYPFICEKKAAYHPDPLAKCKGWTTNYKTMKQYKVFPEAKKYKEASDVCHKEGGHLVEIFSLEENNFVKSLLNPDTSAYIGYHTPDFADGGDTFVWAEGSKEPDFYTNWPTPPGEPTHTPAAGERYCAAIGKDGAWKAVECGLATNAYVCSYKCI